jgi:hypothetical protein
VKKIYTIEFLLIGWRPWFDHSASSETLLYTTLLLPYSFSLVCRCCAVQTTSSSAVVDRPSPRLALWTTRQEDLDVVDLSRLFVGCLRLHYRLITWCQRFASCFLLFFYKKCEQITIEMNDVMIDENLVWIWQSTQKTFTLTSIDLYWILLCKGDWGFEIGKRAKFNFNSNKNELKGRQIDNYVQLVPSL